MRGCPGDIASNRRAYLAGLEAAGGRGRLARHLAEWIGPGRIPGSVAPLHHHLPKLLRPPAGTLRLRPAAGCLALLCDAHADAKPRRATFGLCSGLGQRAVEIRPATPPRPIPRHARAPRRAAAPNSCDPQFGGELSAATAGLPR